MTTQTEHDALAVVRLGFDAFAADILRTRPSGDRSFLELTRASP
jgi:hypothetical protein